MLFPPFSGRVSYWLGRRCSSGSCGGGRASCGCIRRCRFPVQLLGGKLTCDIGVGGVGVAFLSKDGIHISPDTLIKGLNMLLCRASPPFQLGGLTSFPPDHVKYRYVTRPQQRRHCQAMVVVPRLPPRRAAVQYCAVMGAARTSLCILPLPQCHPHTLLLLKSLVSVSLRPLKWDQLLGW